MDTKEPLMNQRSVSEKTVKWIFRSAIITMIIVALSSAILSFEGLQSLALASRVPSELAFLFPITVDTTILMGSLAVLLYELFGMKTMFGWFTVLFGTALSVIGNVISVSDGGITAQVLHGIIPILLCISLESLLRILRFNIKTSVIQSKSHINPIKDTEDNEKSADNPETPLSSNAVEPILSDSNDNNEESSETNIEPRQNDSQPLPQAKEEVAETVIVPIKNDSSQTPPNLSAETPIYDTTPQVIIEENNKATLVDTPMPGENLETVKLEENNAVNSPSGTTPEKPSQKSIPNTVQDAEKESPVEATTDSKPVMDDPMEETNDSTNSSPQQKTKNSSTKPSITVKGFSSLSPTEREKYRVAAKRYLDQGHPAVKVLGEMFKVNNQMTSADVRYIMGYEPTKRVDSLVSRAKKYAKE